MPSGFRVARQEILDVRATAREWSNPDEWLKNYQTWEFFEAAVVEFRKGTLKDSIESSAEVYASIGGAREAFEKQRKEIKDELRKQLEGSDAKILVLEDDKGTRIGDEDSALFHARASVQVLGTSVSMDFVGVLFRRSNVVASVGWTSFDTNILRDDVVQLAIKQDRIIRDQMASAATARAALPAVVLGSSVFEDLLGMIPDTPETRYELWINDLDLVRQLFTTIPVDREDQGKIYLSFPGPDTDDAQLELWRGSLPPLGFDE